MCKLKDIPDDLNITRERLICKGFLTAHEIAVFCNVSDPTGKKFMNIMKKQAKEENKKTLDKYIPIARVLKLLNLTEEKVFKYAEMERNALKEKDALADQSKAS